MTKKVAHHVKKGIFSFYKELGIMLFYRFPSNAISLLSNLPDNEIVRVKRQILESDLEFYENAEQNGDGPVEIELKSGFIFHVIKYSERMSIVLKEGPMPDWGEYYEYMDVSHTYFWRSRMNKLITRVVLLESLDSIEPCEFGIEIWINRSKSFAIQYADGEEYPDTLKITSCYSNISCRRTILRPDNQKIQDRKSYPSNMQDIIQYYSFPSESDTLLSELEKKEIIRVRRQILRSDTFLHNFEQTGDGPIEIRLINELLFHIISHHDYGGILLKKGPMPDCGEFYRKIDVSHTHFWQQRLHKPITKIALLKSSLTKEKPCEFGMEICLDNTISFTIEYVRQDEYTYALKIS